MEWANYVKEGPAAETVRSEPDSDRSRVFDHPLEQRPGYPQPEGPGILLVDVLRDPSSTLETGGLVSLEEGGDKCVHA